MATLSATLPDTLVLATIPIPEGVDLTAFIFAISNANEGIRIEQYEPGFLTLMPPAGFSTSDRNFSIAKQLGNWNDVHKRGRCADSNTLFKLPNGKLLGPDAAWISHERLAGLTDEELDRFIARIPEFVVELLSPSDRRPQVRRKMESWIEAGAELGWMIDPADKSVEIYRRGQAVQHIQNTAKLIADGPVAGFTLKLSEIWAI